MTDRTAESSAAIVGERIRMLRSQHGRTLRQQARAIGISASSLSDIENSRGGISLRRLQRVADHFGLRLTDLLAEPEAARPADFVEVIHSVATTVPAVRRGKGVHYQLIGRPENHAIQPFLLSFEPGASYEDDTIAHPGEEFAYVLFGEIELIFGDEVHRLSIGDSVRFRTETVHAYRNASQSAMATVLGAATPPW